MEKLFRIYCTELSLAAWHNNGKVLAKVIPAVSKLFLEIIQNADANDMADINALYSANIFCLTDRRGHLSHRFFKSILEPASCLACHPTSETFLWHVVEEPPINFHVCLTIPNKSDLLIVCTAELSHSINRSITFTSHPNHPILIHILYCIVL